MSRFGRIWNPARFQGEGVTRRYLTRLGRRAAWRPLAADPGAAYDDAIEIDLSTIEPLVALPGSPDHVVPVGQVEGTPIEQVLVAEWLGEEVDGTGLHRAHRHRNIAVAGHEHNRQIDTEFAELALEIEAAGARQADVPPEAARHIRPLCP